MKKNSLINIVFIKQKYDKLYNEAQKIIDIENPCQFNDGLCIKEHNNIKQNKEVSQYCCCKSVFPNEINHCKHFIEDVGCGVKALGCKIWFCKTAWKNFSKKAKKQMNYIFKQAYNLEIDYIRKSKEELFNGE